MHKRFSLDKAEWSNEREETYKKLCEQKIAFSNSEFSIINNIVYIITENKHTRICKPTKTKTLWYETWLKLEYPNN